ncbi:MAG TPA: enolase C-terminal domain-like protein [Solirubrobacterales bacterium]|nr:enolase C-terminal domain-like protein [Solirubrobacterales bacterium]
MPAGLKAAGADPHTAAPRIDGAEVRVFTVPTDGPGGHESDGTLSWETTTTVVVSVHAGGERGIGYTYGDAAVAALIESKLIDLITGASALRPAAAAAGMQHALRNAGRPGIGAMAISAVDVALWDLKARLLELPLADLLPRFHERVPIYGSGGFTNYDDERLAAQLRGWVAAGIPRVKVKVGRVPERDPERLAVAREAIGPEAELFVDANGAFTPKQALRWAERYADHGVVYFEEPVSSEDRDGLRFVRERAPAGMAIAAGEYEWDLPRLRELAGCVDILQADVTRCGGITNMLRADGICKSRNQVLSAHCAPAISAHVCAAIETTAHIEYFHDHVRVERELFAGTLEPDGGYLRPAPDAPGNGLSLRESAREHEVS